MAIARDLLDGRVLQVLQVLSSTAHFFLRPACSQCLVFCTTATVMVVELCSARISWFLATTMGNLQKTSSAK